MDNLSNELNKLKIDRSKRSEPRPAGNRGLLIVLIILVAAGLLALIMLRRPSAAATVETIHPRLENASQSAVLIATGYVVAHHKIQVGSKIAGRVAWIGVEKGNHVKRDQVVVRLEDREYRAQYDQAKSAFEAAQATEADRWSKRFGPVFQGVNTDWEVLRKAIIWTRRHCASALATCQCPTAHRSRPPRYRRSTTSLPRRVRS